VKLTRIISVAVLISMLAVVGAGVGCGGKGRGGAARGMNMMPENASSFVFVDIKALRSDEDLKGIYTEEVRETFGIDVDDIDCVAASDDLSLLDGRFDFDKVRDGLDGRGFNKSEYKDVEVWENSGEDVWVALMRNFDGSGWLALMRNLIVLGSEDAVKDCITVIEEGKDSLQDNRDARDVMARLPGGVVMMWGIGETFTEIIEQEFEGLDAGGMSLGKKDKDTLKVAVVLKFEDEDAAGDATDEIKDDLEEKGYKDINVNQDKELVKVTGEKDIDDFPG